VLALPLSLYLPSFTKLWCTLQLSEQIHSLSFYSTPICTLFLTPSNFILFVKVLLQSIKGTLITYFLTKSLASEFCVLFEVIENIKKKYVVTVFVPLFELKRVPLQNGGFCNGCITERCLHNSRKVS
jgi:hypothetical protein